MPDTVASTGQRVLRRPSFLALAGILVCVAGVEASGLALITLEQRHVKWGASAYGTGAEITYTFLREPLVDPEARNCRRMAPLEQALGPSGIGRAAFAAEVSAAFALWSDAADLRFREVRGLEDAQIVIGAQAEPRHIAYANITLGQARSEGITALERATICLNPLVNWILARDGNLETYHVRRVLAHEIGHAIGLDHPGPEGGIMGYRYVEPAEGSMAALSAGDIAAIQALYGPRGGADPLIATVSTVPTDGTPAGSAQTKGHALGEGQKARLPLGP